MRFLVIRDERENLMDRHCSSHSLGSPLQTPPPSSPSAVAPPKSPRRRRATVRRTGVVGSRSPALPSPPRRSRQVNNTATPPATSSTDAPAPARESACRRAAVSAAPRRRCRPGRRFDLDISQVHMGFSQSPNSDSSKTRLSIIAHLAIRAFLSVAGNKCINSSRDLRLAWIR